jgi:hypothetical protein
MRALQISAALTEEFATVSALWASSATTRRVDALLLSWVKYEKQLRRLFCFFLYQHPQISEANIDDIVAILAENRDLYPETFLRGIEGLGVQPLKEMLGAKHDALWADVERIKRYRNKLMHGQITGLKISSAQLERDVQSLINWIAAVAEESRRCFGYDGLGRKTFQQAKSGIEPVVQKYPFATPDELKAWITTLTRRRSRNSA